MADPASGSTSRNHAYYAGPPYNRTSIDPKSIQRQLGAELLKRNEGRTSTSDNLTGRVSVQRNPSKETSANTSSSANKTPPPRSQSDLSSEETPSKSNVIIPPKSSSDPDVIISEFEALDSNIQQRRESRPPVIFNKNLVKQRTEATKPAPEQPSRPSSPERARKAYEDAKNKVKIFGDKLRQKYFSSTERAPGNTNEKVAGNNIGKNLKNFDYYTQLNIQYLKLLKDDLQLNEGIFRIPPDAKSSSTFREKVFSLDSVGNPEGINKAIAEIPDGPGKVVTIGGIIKHAIQNMPEETKAAFSEAVAPGIGKMVVRKSELLGKPNRSKQENEELRRIEDKLQTAPVDIYINILKQADSGRPEIRDLAISLLEVLSRVYDTNWSKLSSPTNNKSADFEKAQMSLLFTASRSISELFIPTQKLTENNPLLEMSTIEPQNKLMVSLLQFYRDNKKIK